MKAKKVFLGLMIFFAAVSVGLSVWLGIEHTNRADAVNRLENQYQQAVYSMTAEINNMEVKVAKLVATTSPTIQRELLYEIWKGAEVSANCLSTLSGRDISVTNTMRFVNQTGDFSLFLADNVASGETLTEENYDSLSKIREMLKTLGTELGKIQTEVANGYLFMENMNTDKDILANVFGQLNEPSVDYPKLIYDGPFSEALQDKEVKGATGAEIDETKGKQIVATLSEKIDESAVNYDGEGKADIPTLNFSADIDGQTATFQLAKAGGMPISINIFREVTNPTLEMDECSELARQYLERIGFENMKAVWISNNNSVVYINFAPEVNNIIYYPDLIKIKVASDNGEILGLEAQNYALNHTERSLPSPALTAQQAREKISFNTNASEGRLALIPFKTNQEVLTYEFEMEKDGSYLVYIDASTGEEVNILYIINSDEGDLLM